MGGMEERRLQEWVISNERRGGREKRQDDKEEGEEEGRSVEETIRIKGRKIIIFRSEEG